MGTLRLCFVWQCWVGAVFAVLAGVASQVAQAQTTAAGAGGCFPACRAGYVCQQGQCVLACNPGCAAGFVCAPNGQCVSACNPPCPAGQVCTAEGQCVASAAAGAAPPPPPAGAGAAPPGAATAAPAPAPPAPPPAAAAAVPSAAPTAGAAPPAPGYGVQPGAPVYGAPGYGPPVVAILLPPPDPGWARGAAVTGFVGAGVVLVMTFAVMGANNGDESSGDSARALGIATTVTAAALGPIVAVGGGSARGNPAVVGYPVLRVVSWVGYVVTLLDALALIAISFESEVANSHIFSVGLLGSLSITGFALDALRSAQEAEALRASMRLSLRPAIGFVRDPRGDGRRPTLGLALRF